VATRNRTRPTTGGDSELRSVSIALSILDCFALSPELGPTAVAGELGIAKSTASRMLAVMASRGILERRERGRYRLGMRMFEYGQLALNRLDL
jgi:IclR family KDG regulon transcriptional repressor